MMCTRCSKGIMAGGKREGSLSYVEFNPVDLGN